MGVPSFFEGFLPNFNDAAFKESLNMLPFGEMCRKYDEKIALTSGFPALAGWCSMQSTDAITKILFQNMLKLLWRLNNVTMRAPLNTTQEGLSVL